MVTVEKRNEIEEQLLKYYKLNGRCPACGYGGFAVEQECEITSWYHGIHKRRMRCLRCDAKILETYKLSNIEYNEDVFRNFLARLDDDTPGLTDEELNRN